MNQTAEGGRSRPLWRGGRWLEVLALAVLLLLLAVTVEQMWQIRANVIAGAAQQMARLNMVFAEQTGRAVETVDLIMRGAADEVQSRPDNRPPAAEMNDLLRRRIAGVQQVADVSIADAAGRILYSSRTTPPAELPPAGMTLLAWHTAHADDAMQISEPIRGADGSWNTLLSRRIGGPNGRLDGIVIASLNLLYFEEFYKAVELQENGAIILHRRDGVVLARYPHVDSAVGTSFADLPPFKEILAHDIAGTTEMDSPVDGSRRVVAIRALRLFPLAVQVSVEEARVLVAWRREAGIFALAAVAGFGVIAVLLMLLGRRTRQVEKLLGESQSARDDAVTAHAQLRAQIEERDRAEVALRQAQRIEAVGQLTGGVAHDFNNLLTVLLGNIDLLQQQPVSPVVAERLVRMRGAAERGAKLTDQLLAFSRRQPLQARAMELNEAVRGMTDLLQSAVGSTVRVVTRLPEGSWPALVDPTQIELVILNLALNARDAMPKGGTLSLETGNVKLGVPERPGDPPDGDYVVVSVGDTGIGMSPEVQAKAFEPFFTTKGLGSGLGLSQVYGLARQSGGGVRIESTVGHGTTVRVYLPRATEAPATATGAPALAARGVGSDATVLLVDDDAEVRSTTAMVLQTLGYTVLESDTGSAALRTLAEHPAIEILLTDVAMPGMNGPELARQVRAARPNLPVVFFSGYADPDAVAGDDILQRIVRKPFRATELAAHIEAALAEAGRAAA